MKIGIITFHFVNNFGGALQAYALQEVLQEEFKAETEVIDYRNWFICFTDFVRLFPVTRNKKAMLSGLCTFSRRWERRKNFKKFLKDNFHFSCKYTSFIKLKLKPPVYDRYICGSDQIWNPIITCGVAKPYFLSFVKDNRKKCAYAPSFGTGHIAGHFIKKMKKELVEIEYLSIREKQGISQIREWTGREVDTFIDPTFLLGQEKWRETAEYNVKTPKHYILVYIMQSDYKVYDYVKQIKEKYSLPVVDISRYGYNPGYIDQTVIGIGPAQFLALFDKADIVCTNSYHGLIFSLIFEKKLYLIPSKSFALRMINLLDILKIDSKGICDSDYIEELKYDSSEVDKAIEKERDKALGYLNEFIREKQ